METREGEYNCLHTCVWRESIPSVKGDEVHGSRKEGNLNGTDAWAADVRRLGPLRMIGTVASSRCEGCSFSQGLGRHLLVYMVKMPKLRSTGYVT